MECLQKCFYCLYMYITNDLTNQNYIRMRIIFFPFYFSIFVHSKWKSFFFLVLCTLFFNPCHSQKHFQYFICFIVCHFGCVTSVFGWKQKKNHQWNCFNSRKCDDFDGKTKNDMCFPVHPFLSFIRFKFFFLFRSFVSFLWWRVDLNVKYQNDDPLPGYSI